MTDPDEVRDAASPTPPPKEDPLTSTDFGPRGLKLAQGEAAREEGPKVPSPAPAPDDDPLTSADFGPGGLRSAWPAPPGAQPGEDAAAEPGNADDERETASAEPSKAEDFAARALRAPVTDDDPLTSADFGPRGSARRARQADDDPLTSAEYRVPRASELAALLEVKAEDTVGPRFEAPEPPGSASSSASTTRDDEPVVSPASTRDDEPVVSAPEDEAADEEEESAKADAEEAVEDKAEAKPAIAGELGDRVAALERLIELGEGRLDGALLAEALELMERAGERMRLSGDHTVVTLAGGTGSGKSSLFNAVCGLELSPTGMRRPMTSLAHACVWGMEGAAPLLDWLNIDKRFRYARASALDRSGSRAEGSLRGLVLIDLPDHDSIQAAHRAEVDRFTGVADLLIWVVDPQKYADASLHHDYIIPFARHAAVTLIVLNQVDRLGPAEVKDCVTDLRRLLEAEGLSDPRIITTSAVARGGVDELREILAETVAGQSARAERLGADIDRLIERFERFAGPADAGEVPAEVDAPHAEALIDALTVAAGVPAVAEAMQSAFELRAADYVGWPFARWVRRFRRDPLRMMRLSELREELRDSFTGPLGAQQGGVDSALHGVTDGVTEDLPGPWRLSVRAAARTHAGRLPDELGSALRATVPGFNQVPRWWSLVKIWQRVLVGGTALGLVWSLLLLLYGGFDIAEAPSALIGDLSILPWVLVLTGCMLGMGALTAAACRNVVALSAARHGERIEAGMRETLASIADELVLRPVAAELKTYADYRVTVDGVLR
ncbi:putative GTPase [Actinocorallia herbida]|uniref:Putative GTPase n=1 Tax=Actinocorallia herbida TaxID=58109 RepID=A0A3N1D7M7_9ACTN|nr:GTPase [Actinocorallia herbida]ROO89530.1 putative GTPase [Actinocorallia herbida]